MYTCIIIPNGSLSLQGIIKGIAKFYGLNEMYLQTIQCGYSTWRVYDPTWNQLALVDYVNL